MNIWQLILDSLGWILFGLIWLAAAVLVVGVTVGLVRSIRKPRKTHGTTTILESDKSND